MQRTACRYIHGQLYCTVLHYSALINAGNVAPPVTGARCWLILLAWAEGNWRFSWQAFKFFSLGKVWNCQGQKSQLSALLATSILWNGVEQAIGFHLLTGCILQSSFPYHFFEIFSLPISIKISYKNLTSSTFSCAVFYMYLLMSQFSSICIHTIIHNVNLFPFLGTGTGLLTPRNL